MKNIIIPLLVLLTSCYCKTPEVKVVYIQPLGDVNESHIQFVKKSVESFYGYKCLINPKEDLTKDLISASGTRYEANKILKKFKSNKNLLIITEKDIACKKGDIPEWGVLGLGYRPGKTCVVSTFRMRSKSDSKFKDRLKKVSIHEIGHNLGLDHCTNDSKCLMNDAKGTIKQIDKESVWLCSKCKSLISN